MAGGCLEELSPQQGMKAEMSPPLGRGEPIVQRFLVKRLVSSERSGAPRVRYGNCGLGVPCPLSPESPAAGSFKPLRARAHTHTQRGPHRPAPPHRSPLVWPGQNKYSYAIILLTEHRKHSFLHPGGKLGPQAMVLSAGTTVCRRSPWAARRTSFVTTNGNPAIALTEVTKCTEGSPADGGCRHGQVESLYQQERTSQKSPQENQNRNTKCVCVC